MGKAYNLNVTLIITVINEIIKYLVGYTKTIRIIPICAT